MWETVIPADLQTDLPIESHVQSHINFFQELHNNTLGLKKIMLCVSANPTDPILSPRPYNFVGKFVDTGLKEQYKTVIPLSWDCKSVGH